MNLISAWLPEGIQRCWLCSNMHKVLQLLKILFPLRNCFFASWTKPGDGYQCYSCEWVVFAGLGRGKTGVTKQPAACSIDREKTYWVVAFRMTGELGTSRSDWLEHYGMLPKNVSGSTMLCMLQLRNAGCFLCTSKYRGSVRLSTFRKSASKRTSCWKHLML